MEFNAQNSIQGSIQKDEEIEIDLADLFFFLLSKVLYILFAGAVTGVLALLITVFLIHPKYTSYTSMYVLNRQTDESITNSDLQSSTYLTQDYMEIIKSRTVLEKVIADLSLDATYESLSEAVGVETASDTRIIRINVTDEDPYRARDIAENIRVAASAEIQRVMNTEAVNVVDEANIPVKKSSPSTTRNVLLAVAVGFFISVVCFVIQYVVNDKVITAEDVEKYLGLSLLGELPVDENELKQKKKRMKERNKKKRQSWRKAK